DSVHPELPEFAQSQQRTVGFWRRGKQRRIYLLSRPQHGGRGNKFHWEGGVAFLWQHQLCGFAELHLRRSAARRSTCPRGVGLAGKEFYARRKPRHGRAGVLLLSALNDEGPLGFRHGST